MKWEKGQKVRSYLCLSCFLRKNLSGCGDLCVIYRFMLLVIYVLYITLCCWRDEG